MPDDTQTTSPGQAAYEADISRAPNYPDGQDRPDWVNLFPGAKDAWERHAKGEVVEGLSSDQWGAVEPELRSFVTTDDLSSHNSYSPPSDERPEA